MKLEKNASENSLNLNFLSLYANLQKRFEQIKPQGFQEKIAIVKFKLDFFRKSWGLKEFLSHAQLEKPEKIPTLSCRVNRTLIFYPDCESILSSGKGISVQNDDGFIQDVQSLNFRIESYIFK
jgi:hypothetical protein